MAALGTSTSTILRIRNHHLIDGAPIRRVIGHLQPSFIVALFEATDLAANPRLPRVNKQVRAMWDAIEQQPTSFVYMNNGILVAGSGCEELDRERFRLRFDPCGSEEHPRGVLNGGHTLLACVSSLVRQAADVSRSKMPRIDDWSEFRETVWPEWRERVIELLDLTKESTEFRVPVEILFPAENQTEEYDALIHEIADARNNNCQLTEETKANHAGYYSELKNAIPEDIRTDIEWRTNDEGRIKARDVVALACIPLSVISEEVAHVRIDLKQCYNSPARCSAYFNEIYRLNAVPENAQYVLTDDEEGRHGRLVASAIALTGDAVRLYDWLQVEFPRAYNQAGGHFGQIDSVKISGNGRQYTTLFFRRPCEYSYSPGFFMPILTAITQLIRRDGDRLMWSLDPKAFLARHMERIMKTFKGHIRSRDYDGRLVGRDPHSYDLVHETVSDRLEIEQLREHAG